MADSAQDAFFGEAAAQPSDTGAGALPETLLEELAIHLVKHEPRLASLAAQVRRRGASGTARHAHIRHPLGACAWRLCPGLPVRRVCHSLTCTPRVPSGCTGLPVLEGSLLRGLAVEEPSGGRVSS